jgi:type 1 glutamine amidotransferase
VKVPRLGLAAVGRSLLLLLLFVPAFALAQAEVAKAPNPPALRALILSGGGRHDWQSTTPFLRRLLDSTARFEVKVCETPVGLSAETLAPFDLIVDDYAGERLGGVAEKAIESFVESGKGLVVIHDRLFAFDSAVSDGKGPERGESWAGFAAMTKASKPAARGANPVAPLTWFPVKISNPQHPIVLGMKDGQKTADRPCVDFTLGPTADVLLTTETGQPLAFASSFGKGRVFVTALGYDLAAMQERLFISTMLRGAEWAASGQVTLPAELGMPESKTPEVRVLVITGGHDHEASFYRLFEDYTKFGWVPVSDSKTAFQQDLRGKYDVLVLYDFTRDLDDKGKENLRAFV